MTDRAAQREDASSAELAEMRALAKRLLERITRYEEKQAGNAPRPVTEPRPEIYASILARRKKRGRQRDR